MKMQLLHIALLGLAVSSASQATETAHWGYTGHSGPAHWGELAPEFATCSSGKNQSPIDLANMIEGDLAELEVNYKAGGNEVTNNGHTIKINYDPGSSMAADGHEFELKQVHFHAPSENTIQGRSYPMEGHFVHADKDGNLAVISVMYEIGDKNPELEKAWRQMPSEIGKVNQLSGSVNAEKLLPAKQGYYRFNGSLTTPPCSEGVNWFVMKQIDSVSKDQLNEFRHVMHHDNNRPVQPLNARVVIE